MDCKYQNKNVSREVTFFSIFLKERLEDITHEKTEKAPHIISLDRNYNVLKSWQLQMKCSLVEQMIYNVVVQFFTKISQL